MVRPAGFTSTKPPRTKSFETLAPASAIVTMPGFSVDMKGAWSFSTVNSPSVPGTTTDSTSPVNSSRSGETSSKGKVAMDQDDLARRCAFSTASSMVPTI